MWEWWLVTEESKRAVFSHIVHMFHTNLDGCYGLTHNPIMRNVKSYSYRYLVNSYDFVTDTLSLTTAQRELPNYTWLTTRSVKVKMSSFYCL
jgi:hypothetical protein